jgi:peroxiredoxin
MSPVLTRSGTAAARQSDLGPAIAWLRTSMPGPPYLRHLNEKPPPPLMLKVLHTFFKHLLQPSSVRRAAILSTVAGLAIVIPLSARCEEPTVGQPSVDFALRSLTGANVRLSEHRGEVVLINFWATWCGPCRQEMPLLDELYSKYQRAGFTLLGVNIDATAAQAGEMVHALKVTYPVLLDDRQEVSRAYRVGSMPLTVLIDRQGVVRYVSQGFKPGFEKRYAEWLRELLNE